MSLEKKPNPVKTKFLDDTSSIINIDLSKLKDRGCTSTEFTFILQKLPQPSTEGYSHKVIYNVKDFLKSA